MIVVLLAISVSSACWIFSPDDSGIALCSGIEGTVMEDTVTPTGLTFIIVNETNEIATFGRMFTIEKKSGFGWRELERIDGAYFADAIRVEPGGSREWTESWRSDYGELSPGRYRMIKTITVGDGLEKVKHDITIEFLISE